MIYAAWFDLHNDDTIVDHPTAMRVYARLLRNPLIFIKPQDVKAWALAEQMHTHRDRVNAALELLVKRGYVIEHARGTNNVRRLTLAMERTPPPATVPAACHRNEAAPKPA
jgi:hypothetical protein